MVGMDVILSIFGKPRTPTTSEIDNVLIKMTSLMRIL